MADQGVIKIRGARVHNLQAVDLDLPLGKLVCFMGPSGSGKTSLAFHTLHTESKRRFINSFPNALKFFADRPAPVDVDEIHPVLPVFGLPQVNPVMGSRSVVADVMRATDFLQALYHQYAPEYCPIHGEEVRPMLFTEQLMEKTEPLKGEVFHLLVDGELGEALFGNGFTPNRSWSVKRGGIGAFDPVDEKWEVLRFRRGNAMNLEKSHADMFPRMENRPLAIWAEGMKKPLPFIFVKGKRCPRCDYRGHIGLTPGAFTPHTALGACKACNGYGAKLVYDDKKMLDRDLTFEEGGVAFLRFGPLDWWRKELVKLMKRKKWPQDEPLKKLPKEFFHSLREGEGAFEGFSGIKKYLESKRYKPAVRVFLRKMQTEELCLNCMGSRMSDSVDNFLLSFGGKKYALKEFAALTIQEFAQLMNQPSELRDEHAVALLNELTIKAKRAQAMGLGHLQLGRKAKSLSAGEYQRLLLLKYLSFQGTGSLFVLDEPSLGLGEEEQKMLIAGLREVIDQGNSVVVVDHSSFIQRNADYLVVMGPGSGHMGGKILFEGSPRKYTFPEPAELLSKLPEAQSGGVIKVEDPRAFGKSWESFAVPLHQVIWAHGPSGSGKSACLVNVLAQTLSKKIHKENLVQDAGVARSITGAKSVKDVIVVDADLTRTTSRSTVGSVTGLAPVVRRHFLKLPVAKALGLKEGHLSRHSDLGMCPRCEGRGQLVIEMQYLEDIVLPCEDCHGQGMKPMYASVSDGVMTVAESFNLPLGQVLSRIELTPKFKRTWEYLKILNLEYLSLERPLNSLSGGERQRLHLLSKLLSGVRDNLVIIENLSFGLSPREIAQVGRFLGELANLKNTFVIVDADPLFSRLSHSELVFSPKGLS